MNAPITPADTPARRWHLALVAAGRVVLSVVILVVLYYVLPLDGAGDNYLFVLFLVLLPLLAVIMGLQVWAILHSSEPRRRAVEALAVTIPLLILNFAATYYVMGIADPSMFSEPLTRTDALYFAVTVLATVGFGDVVPTTESARLAVTVQMVVNLLVLGIGLRIILGAVRLAEEKSGTTSSADAPVDG